MQGSSPSGEGVTVRVTVRRPWTAGLQALMLSIKSCLRRVHDQSIGSVEALPHFPSNALTPAYLR